VRNAAIVRARPAIYCHWWSIVKSDTAPVCVCDGGAGLEELRSKFDEDRRRLAKMREGRKFKPY